MSRMTLSVGLMLAAAAIAILMFLLWKAAYTARIRRESLKQSVAVTAGKVYEQLVPLLPGFDFNPKDARFLGSPVDFVVFDGLDEGELRRVVFVEVKTGGAELNARERRVRDAIQAGRVEWMEHRPDRQG